MTLKRKANVASAGAAKIARLNVVALTRERDGILRGNSDDQARLKQIDATLKVAGHSVRVLPEDVITRDGRALRK